MQYMYIQYLRHTVHGDCQHECKHKLYGGLVALPGTSQRAEPQDTVKYILPLIT